MVKIPIPSFFHPFNFPCLNPGTSCKFFSFPVNHVASFIFQVNHFKSTFPLTLLKRVHVWAASPHPEPDEPGMPRFSTPYKSKVHPYRLVTRYCVSWYTLTLVGIFSTDKDNLTPWRFHQAVRLLSPVPKLPTRESKYHNTLHVVIR